MHTRELFTGETVEIRALSVLLLAVNRPREPARRARVNRFLLVFQGFARARELEGFDQPVHSLSVGPRKRVFLFCLDSNLIRIGYVPFFDIAHTGF